MLHGIFTYIFVWWDVDVNLCGFPVSTVSLKTRRHVMPGSIKEAPAMLNVTHSFASIAYNIAYMSLLEMHDAC